MIFLGQRRNRRSFAIEGDPRTAPLHDGYMGEPFLSGMLTRGEVVYAGSEGDAAHDREPVAIFTGEVLPLYAGDLDDETVRMLLNELASEIGCTLEQEEVHVGYRDRTWTLKRSE
jgi:hypothetical protein